MANMILFRSSVMSGIAQLFMIFFYRLPTTFFWIVFAGVLSSVLNHGLTDEILIIFDRLVMTVGFCIHGVYLNIFLYNHEYYIITWLVMITAVALYFISKYIPHKIVANIFHVLAHVFLCILHTLLSISLHRKCDFQSHILC